MGSKTNFRGEGLYSHNGRCCTIKIDQQELFDYDKLDFITQNIASIERQSKEQAFAQHTSRFPTYHIVTNPYNE